MGDRTAAALFHASHAASATYTSVYRALNVRYQHLRALVAALRVDPDPRGFDLVEIEINASQPKSPEERLVQDVIGMLFSDAEPSAAFALNRPALLLWLGTVGIERGLGLRGVATISVEEGGRVRVASLGPAPPSFDAPAGPAVKTGFGVCGVASGEARFRARGGRSRGGEGAFAGRPEAPGGRGGRGRGRSGLGGPGGRGLPAPGAACGSSEPAFDWAAALRSMEAVGRGEGGDPYGVGAEAGAGAGAGADPSAEKKTPWWGDVTAAAAAPK